MRCSLKGCQEHAVSLSEFCWDHIPDKKDYTDKLVRSVNGGADLTGGNLRKIVLADVHLENANLSRADLSQFRLSDSRLFNSNLIGADMVGSHLSDCDLTHCNLSGADMTKASFSGSRLWNSTLDNANLTESDLSKTDLWGARLFNVKLLHTDLSNAKGLTVKSFSKNGILSFRARINEEGLLSAEESYRNLKQYFISKGMYNDASWTSFKEKTMERLSFKKKGSLHYIPSLFMNMLCGYGEKPYRIVLSAVGTILFFSVLYLAFNSIEPSAAPKETLNWIDYIYFSTITFTTVGYGDIIPKPYWLFRGLAASEGFIGTFLTGLFIFTLARKYSAR